MSEQAARSKLLEVLNEDFEQLLEDWMSEQQKTPTLRPDLFDKGELRRESKELLKRLRQAVAANGSEDRTGEEWTPVRELLEDFSNGGAQKGLNPSEVATFVFSLKQPLFAALHRRHGKELEPLLEDVWSSTRLLDELGLYTNETFIKNRERIIDRQRQEMMELSTPVVKLWSGILALPIIGVLDSERAQVVTESLLQKIVETESSIAIIDITGVPTVDTLVAQHLLKTVAAAQLMGATCIISGIRPQIAQTIVHLGIDLQGITTKSTIADALAVALERAGYSVALTEP